MCPTFITLSAAWCSLPPTNISLGDLLHEYDFLLTSLTDAYFFKWPATSQRQQPGAGRLATYPLPLRLLLLVARPTSTYPPLPLRILVVVARPGSSNRIIRHCIPPVLRSIILTNLLQSCRHIPIRAASRNVARRSKEDFDLLGLALLVPPSSLLLVSAVVVPASPIYSALHTTM